MEIYGTGVFFAFVLSLIRGIHIVVQVFSNRTENLKKIGLHYNPSTGEYSESKPSGFSSLFLIIDIFFFSPLLSWLSVVWVSISYIRDFLKRASDPEKIKEFRYKLSLSGLSKEKVQEYAKDVEDFLGIKRVQENQTEVPTTEKAISGDVEENNTLVLEAGKWYSELRLDQENMRYTMYGHTPDYDSIFTSIIEYKFDEFTLLVRTLEDQTEHAGEDEKFDIKDNVVLESEIREREKDSIFGKASLEERIGRLRKEVEWHKLEFPKIQFYIMSKHPEKFTPFEFRRFLRSELERINLGSQKLRELIDLNGGTITESDGVFDVELKDKENRADLEKLRSLFQESHLASLKISEPDFLYSKQRIDEIKVYLRD